MNYLNYIYSVYYAFSCSLLLIDSPVSPLSSDRSSSDESDTIVRSIQEVSVSTTKKRTKPIYRTPRTKRRSTRRKGRANATAPQRPSSISSTAYRKRSKFNIVVKYSGKLPSSYKGVAKPTTLIDLTLEDTVIFCSCCLIIDGLIVFFFFFF